MDGGTCILQLRGVRPFRSDKYDITRHPNFKDTADADKRNTFDIEAFLSARLKLKPDELSLIHICSMFISDIASMIIPPKIYDTYIIPWKIK